VFFPSSQTSKLQGGREAQVARFLTFHPLCSWHPDAFTDDDEKPLIFSSLTRWPVVGLLPIAELDCSGGYGPRCCAALLTSLFLGQPSKPEALCTYLWHTNSDQARSVFRSRACYVLFLDSASVASVHATMCAAQQVMRRCPAQQAMRVSAASAEEESQGIVTRERLHETAIASTLRVMLRVTFSARLALAGE